MVPVLAMFHPQPKARSTCIWVIREKGNQWRVEGLENAPLLHAHQAPSVRGRVLGVGPGCRARPAQLRNGRGREKGVSCPHSYSLRYSSPLRFLSGFIPKNKLVPPQTVFAFFFLKDFFPPQNILCWLLLVSEIIRLMQYKFY